MDDDFRFALARAGCYRGCASPARAVGSRAPGIGGNVLAHDFRVMHDDRGFLCLPEVDIQIPFTPDLNALMTARLSKQMAHGSMTTSRRYGGVDTAAAAIVDRAAREAEVLSTALEIATANAGKAGQTLGTIKERMYVEALAVLRDH